MVKLNHKVPIIFHNLRNHDSHLIMQELSKFFFSCDDSIADRHILTTWRYIF